MTGFDEKIMLNVLGFCEERGVEPLLIVCGGSFSYGLASKTSDVDARFVFKRPYEDYISLVTKRDAYESNSVEGIDLCGWDVRKFMKLLLKGNPSCTEWLSTKFRLFVDPRIQPLFDYVDDLFMPREYIIASCGMARAVLARIERDGAASSKTLLNALRPVLYATDVYLNNRLTTLDVDTLCRKYMNGRFLQFAMLAIELKRRGDGRDVMSIEGFGCLIEYVSACIAKLLDIVGQIEKHEPDWALADEVMLGILNA